MSDLQLKLTDHDVAPGRRERIRRRAHRSLAESRSWLHRAERAYAWTLEPVLGVGGGSLMLLWAFASAHALVS